MSAQRAILKGKRNWLHLVEQKKTFKTPGVYFGEQSSRQILGSTCFQSERKNNLIASQDSLR